MIFATDYVASIMGHTETSLHFNHQDKHSDIGHKRGNCDDLPKCLFHRLLHNRLHLILYAVSDLDNYLVMLSMNNTGIYPLQPTRNVVQGKFEVVSAICLNWKIE